jgi:Ser/Thr protein kinase RdoA (MazF antagonist)
VDLSADEAAGAVAGRFAIGGVPTAVARLSGGHINDSFHVAAPAGDFLLQRLNPRVFGNGVHVMENVAHVTRHFAARAHGSRWRTLDLVPTRGGTDWWTDAAGACWRLYRFMTGVLTRGRADTPGTAREAAAAFGAFIRLLADYEGPALHETIPGFHDTPRRLSALDDAARRDARGRAGAVRAEVESILAERDVADVLPPLVRDGAIPLRIVHNDAKIANVLFDATSGTATCVIDLDTVMPGLALHDFGDMVRSMASPTDEDDRGIDRVEARPEFVEALAAGFLAEAGGVLTPAEKRLLVFAGRLITLEQAARFLTDHLEGDLYYHVARPGHNLERTRTQLALFQSLKRQEPALVARIARLAP